MDISQLKELTVLYVEDDEAIMQSFGKILKKVFKEVHTGINGLEGLAIFKANPDVDFVITDIKMPKMDGLEMAEEINKLNPEVPCILTTAHGEYEYFLQADAIGVYRYIQKPININELLQSLVEYKVNP